jgi:hypothetical protein
MAYPTVNGVPLDQIFDPYISGTKASLTGYTVVISGIAVDLRDLFAPIYLGSSALPTKYKVNNADLNTIFAKKGTAQYALGFNGGSYSSSRVRAAASITLQFDAIGTWQVIRDADTSGGAGTVLATGSWLNFGGTAADYTVKFATADLVSGPDPGGGTDSLVNQATTAKVLTSTYFVRAGAEAVLVGNDADNTGTMTAYLYKNGSLISTSTCSVDCVSTGT